MTKNIYLVPQKLRIGSIKNTLNVTLVIHKHTKELTLYDYSCFSNFREERAITSAKYERSNNKGNSSYKVREDREKGMEHGDLVN